VTWETLRELASFRAGRGCALSLYVDLDPSVAPTPADIEPRLNSLLTEAEREAERRGFEHDPKQALLRDVAGVRAWWGREFDRDGARGVAVFACSLEGLWRALPLPERVDDEVRVSSRLCVAPLVPVVGRADGALVALVSRERGQVFRLRDGRLDEIVDQFEEQPGRHDQGGWSQARYQRHIEKLVRDHLKSVGGEIDRRMRRAGGPEMVIVAPPELRGEIEATLSPEARESIVGWASVEAHATPAEVLQVVRPHLDRARERQVTEALERWRSAAGRQERAASGWAEVLEAASDGRVELLLVQRGASHGAYRCPECGRAALGAGACPLDGRELEPERDGLDLAVHEVLAHGGSILPVEGSALGASEGIAALLRF
jgi:peptide chain release factor subunit 1